MAVLATSLNGLGLILLAHAHVAPHRATPSIPTNTPHSVYSAYEFSLLPAAPPLPRTSALDPRLTLPTDITLETLASVLLLCVGIVLSAPDLKPIQWRVWAGKMEREKKPVLRNLDRGLGSNPYAGLERRTGFVDIRKLRAEFTAWVREGKTA